jgi:hypothetical protein
MVESNPIGTNVVIVIFSGITLGLIRTLPSGVRLAVPIDDLISHEPFMCYMPHVPCVSTTSILSCHLMGVAGTREQLVFLVHALHFGFDCWLVGACSAMSRPANSESGILSL